MTKLTTTTRKARAAEFKAAQAAAPTAAAKYWAGSAFASVARDYQAGRATTIKAR